MSEIAKQNKARRIGIRDFLCVIHVDPISAVLRISKFCRTT
jgi:hypothetical protein